MLLDENGVLQFSDEPTFSRARLVDGILELDALTGSFFEIDADGILQLAEVESGAGAMFVGDQGTNLERPAPGRLRRVRARA